MATYYHILGHGNEPTSSEHHYRTVAISRARPSDTVIEVRYDCRLPVIAQLTQIARSITNGKGDILVGHSLGGLYALAMESMDRKICRLVLLNPSLYPDVTLAGQLGHEDEMRRVTPEQLHDLARLRTIILGRDHPLTGVSVHCEGDVKLQQWHRMFTRTLSRRGISAVMVPGGTHSGIHEKALKAALDLEIDTNTQ